MKALHRKLPCKIELDEINAVSGSSCYLDYVPDALIVDLSDPTLIEKRLKQCTHPIVKFVSVTHEIVYSYARSMELTFPITMNFYLSHWK